MYVLAEHASINDTIRSILDRCHHVSTTFGPLASSMGAPSSYCSSSRPSSPGGSPHSSLTRPSTALTSRSSAAHITMRSHILFSSPCGPSTPPAAAAGSSGGTFSSLTYYSSAGAVSSSIGAAPRSPSQCSTPPPATAAAAAAGSMAAPLQQSPFTPRGPGALKAPSPAAAAAAPAAGVTSSSGSGALQATSKQQQSLGGAGTPAAAAAGGASPIKSWTPAVDLNPGFAFRSGDWENLAA
jgi:hypothetical protein